MIPEPEWVDEDVLHLLHDEQVELFGGSFGVRDEDRILSALAAPRFLYQYGEDVDLADLAAAYLDAFARSQGFMDGNKRTAVICCLTFLDVNGSSLHVPQRHLYWVAMAVAKNQLPREAVAEWLRRHVQPRQDRPVLARAASDALRTFDRLLDRLIRWTERAPPELADLPSELRRFVRQHPRGWSHSEWQSLLDHLAQLGYDTSNPDAIGMHLERERLRVHLESVRGLSSGKADNITERFGTLYSLRYADVDALAREAKIPRRLAERIKVAIERLGG